ncbi:hypothetical protein MF1_05030 [Bartonella quintana]|nr:hypothetical protein MF1_05030 [Bartonella quintana]
MSLKKIFLKKLKLYNGRKRCGCGIVFFFSLFYLFCSFTIYANVVVSMLVKSDKIFLFVLNQVIDIF